MIKYLFIVLLLLSTSSQASDYSSEGYNWFDLCPSKEQVLKLLLLASFPNQTLADNCTNSSSGPYSASQTEAFTWFQLGTGIFASVLIFNNFYAAYYFYDRHEKDQAKLLEEHIAEIKEENARLIQNREEAELIRQKIRRRLIGYKK